MPVPAACRWSDGAGFLKLEEGGSERAPAAAKAAARAATHNSSFNVFMGGGECSKENEMTPRISSPTRSNAGNKQVCEPKVLETSGL